MKITIFGAGRSTSFLVNYLSDYGKDKNYAIKICDYNLDAANELASGNNNVVAHKVDVFNNKERQALVEDNDLIISMLPANMHPLIAQDCVAFGINMATASYVTPQLKEIGTEAEKKGLTFVMECGLDPGIDHMSAMQLLDKIRAEGGEIIGFESFTGGLIAPDSVQNNPWEYKFTWNPRNVVLAGQGSAVKFIQNGQYKYIPYHRLFRRTEVINIENYGKYEGYANRDSLKYRKTYGLDNIQTMYRGTLRKMGFCKAWNVFVQLGATDDSYTLEDSENMTFRDFINTFLPYHITDSVETKFKYNLNIRQDDVALMEKMEWLDLFSRDKKVGLKNASPAQILQHILQQKWALKTEDKDMIVMWHKINYELKGKKIQLISSMVCEGENQSQTAMAKTVGLPLAITCKLLLENKIKMKGVVLPITSDIYNPVLKELEDYGIVFKEK